jgi:5'-nucleotidase
MFDPPDDLSHARILITNDDGIRSPGLAELYEVAKSLSDDVWVCAPEVEQSATSHSLTISRPLRIRHIDARRFAVDGTPTDCVLLAINNILGDRRPDLVLSGINLGSNIGDDVTYSGTIAAAMEATLLGVPSIALSQHIGTWENIDWGTARHYAGEVIQRIVKVPWEEDVLINVNFPAVTPNEVSGIEVVRHGKRKIGDNLVERIDPRGKTYFWIGVARGKEGVPEDTDIAVIDRSGITVTPLSMDLNHPPTLARMEKAFS